MPSLCPVLIGRDDLLDLADRRLAGAHAGTGHLLFLAGEAGIGKTRLLAAICERAVTAGFAVFKVAAYPGDAEIAGGVLADLAAATGSGLDVRLREGDTHRQRRMLAVDLAAEILKLPGPVLLAFEDLHWADDLTLEVLDRVARLVRTVPLLVVGTYRSDELYPRVPTRAWRTRMLTQRLAEEARLPRLSRAESAAMAALIAGAAVPKTVTTAVHERSDGIPLHVEEFLAIIGAPGAGARAVPDTLADAVLARAANLTPRAFALAGAASVIGRSFDLDLLTAITSDSPEEVDAALRELAERFFVQPRGDGSGYDFRHSLIRDALYADLSPLRRRGLHLRTAEAAVAAGFRDAFVSDQFERAQQPALAYRHALAAATEAVGLSAHREAVDLYRRAQRTTPSDTPVPERADLLAALGTELAAVDDNAGAAIALAEAYRLRRDIGADVAAAEVVPALATARHALGADIDERDELLRSAFDLLDGAGPATGTTRARILAALSAAYMLDRCLDDSIEFGRRAKALDAADPATRLNVDATLGAALVFGGKMDEGWQLMTSAVADASAAQLEAEVSRGHRMIGCCASALVEYDRGLTILRDGFAYADRIERFNDRNYMAAHLGHVFWATGDWPAAQRWADQALADGRGDLGTQVTALHVLGYLALGRGDRATAADRLHAARELGERVGELQRLSPALWGLAELALQTGQPKEATVWCEQGWTLSDPSWDAAYLFPYVVTGVRAYLAIDDPSGARDWFSRCTHRLRYRMIPGTLPALEHAQGLLHLAEGHTGRARTALAEAGAGWDERQRFWEGVQALQDQARAANRSRRPAEANALAAEARRRAVAAGATALLDAVPVAAEEEPAVLTLRETEVARLVATGATNRQIAETLFISPKTVAAHVEHILTKLGASRRTEIAAWAAAKAAS